MSSTAARGGFGSTSTVRLGGSSMAQGVLDRLRVRTLFIVGGNDLQVLDLNRQAFAQLVTEKRFEVIAGAGHLSEARCVGGGGTAGAGVVRALSGFGRQYC